MDLDMPATHLYRHKRRAIILDITITYSIVYYIRYSQFKKKKRWKFLQALVRYAYREKFQFIHSFQRGDFSMIVEMPLLLYRKLKHHLHWWMMSASNGNDNLTESIQKEDIYIEHIHKKKKKHTLYIITSRYN